MWEFSFLVIEFLSSETSKYLIDLPAITILKIPSSSFPSISIVPVTQRTSVNTPYRQHGKSRDSRFSLLIGWMDHVTSRPCFQLAELWSRISSRSAAGNDRNGGSWRRGEKASSKLLLFLFFLIGHSLSFSLFFISPPATLLIVFKLCRTSQKEGEGERYLATCFSRVLDKHRIVNV